MRKSDNKALLLALLVGLLMLSGPAFAQTSTPAQTSPLLEIETSADEPAPHQQRISVSTEVLMSEPLAMGIGLGWGVAMQGAYRLKKDWPVFALLRLSTTRARESNRAWHIAQQELHVSAGLEGHYVFGRGLLLAQLGVGGMWLHEQRTRQQADRLAGLLDDSVLRQTAWSLGPYAQSHVGVRVLVWRALALSLRLGAQLANLRVDGNTQARWGWWSAIGINYGF